MRIDLDDETRDFLMAHTAIQRDRYNRRLEDLMLTPSGRDAVEKIREHWDKIHDALLTQLP